ncbi:FAD-binding oxidoreductase [Candidatus Bipolaricaulota bacterium]|nr:FAD-binding oxidoreductase [Candidatus Bipolaricaulota bacterium]
MNDSVIKELVEIVGEDWTLWDLEMIEGYLYDETPKPVTPKAVEDVVIVKPKNTDEISELLKLANKKDLRVIPRGAGTGLCGAAVPTKESILLSLERLDEIPDLDANNLTVTCEAGVTLEELFEEIDKTGDLFFPPHPGDEGAQIGGLVVENAGGARAVKYGVVRNHVTGIKGVLPTGEQVKFGGKVLKNNSGYDLMHLLIGSEGTLGIITEVTLRLYPEPDKDATLIVPFENRQDAIESVPQILRKGFIPLAIEYIEKEHIDKAAEHLGEKWPAVDGEAQLVVIIVSQSEEELYVKAESVSRVCKENNSLEMLMAERSKEQKKILDIRSNLYSTYQTEMAEDIDIAVPPVNLGRMLKIIDQVEEETGVSIPTWGHAGDGNLHLHVMMKDGEKPDNLEEVKENLYREAINIGGVITGEHGIGKTRVKNLPLMFNKTELDLMRRVKEAFDPHSILNPDTAI